MGSAKFVFAPATAMRPARNTGTRRPSAGLWPIKGGRITESLGAVGAALAEGFPSLRLAPWAFTKRMALARRCRWTDSYDGNRSARGTDRQLQFYHGRNRMGRPPADAGNRKVAR